MPRSRDILQRFRSAGTPGAATATGVPADRVAELSAELEPVLAQLVSVQQEVSRIRADAHNEAERRRRGVRAETTHLTGDPAALLLAEASNWGADLLVIGRSGVRGTGRPFVGAVTRKVLELLEAPVLVVPHTI